MSGDPQAAVERRVAARHLVQHPLTCLEDDPDTFRLIRRHEAELDRWFTQRLGYRLHVDADSARLFKTTALVDHRPLRAGSSRALHQLEHVLLALVLAATAAGPAVISLRDLVDNVRSAAAEADIALSGDATERRALVAVLRWMIDHGLAAELHAHVDAYATDDTADAVLKVRPDRIALLPLPTLVGAPDATSLLARADRRSATRQWLRSRLVEEPVVYRDDLDEGEWGELRRRLGDEERMLDEMFGLVLEARAEGVAAIDPTGALAGRRFPTTGTVGHAAVLLLDRLARSGPGDGAGDADGIGPAPGHGTGGTDGPRPAPGEGAGDADGFRPVTMAEVTAHVGALGERNARRWANDLVASPDKLAGQVVDLLVALRLAERVEGTGGDHGPGPAPAGGAADAVGDGVPADAGRNAGPARVVRILPAAARFRPVETAKPEPDAAEGALW